MRRKVLKASLEEGNPRACHPNSKHCYWWVLKLNCSHIVGRYISKNGNIENPPKRITCEYCTKNEKAIQRNYFYTSDDEEFSKNLDTGEHHYVD